MMKVDYIIRSPSPLSIISDLSNTTDDNDNDVEPVQVISIPPPATNRSRLTYYEEHAPVILTPKPLAIPISSYQPYIVTTTTPMYRQVMREPTKTVMIQEIVTPQEPSTERKSALKW